MAKGKISMDDALRRHVIGKKVRSRNHFFLD